MIHRPATIQSARPAQSRALALLLAVAVIWALELFAFQALSFHFDYPVPLAKRVGAQTVRLLLDLLFSLGLVFLLPRVWTILACIGFILFAQGANYYQSVFGRVLSWNTLQGQFSEGLEVMQFNWGYANGFLLLALVLALLAKVWLLLRVTPPADLRTCRLSVGLAALAGYGLLLGVAMMKIDRPDKLRTFVSNERFGMTYGFLPLWASEFVYRDMTHLLDEAVAQRALATDRLSAIESPVALTGDVVVLQVESLDWRILNHHVDGRAVTPFLNRLAEDAMLFRIAPFHRNGSGDADFVMLNAVPPSPTLMTYIIEKYPYQNTLPQVAARAGYASVALHGNSGRFFERKRTFMRMGFTRTLFLEEMRDDLGAPVSLWGIRDDTVLEISRAMIAATPRAGRQLHYLITLTSHQPFIYLEPEHQTFIAGKGDFRSRFFNNMHFVDRQIETYIGGLPAGTLVVVFGDHRAMVEYDLEAGVRADPAERVPLFIHRVGDRLASQQKSRGQPVALSGELTQVDAASYIQKLFSQTVP
ncbi:MAG: LTA synthase family protein [Lentisphaerae bacterium]|nr:LTA synthase family protein [Lentisphaerota bacterium]